MYLPALVHPHINTAVRTNIGVSGKHKTPPTVYLLPIFVNSLVVLSVCLLSPKHHNIIMIHLALIGFHKMIFFFNLTTLSSTPIGKKLKPFLHHS